MITMDSINNKLPAKHIDWHELIVLQNLTLILEEILIRI